MTSKQDEYISDAGSSSVKPARSRLSRVVWTIALFLAGVMIIVVALVTVGALIPGLGFLSLAGGLLAATASPHFVLLSLAVAVFGFLGLKRGMRRSGGVVLGLGATTAFANIAVVSILTATITQAGGSVHLVEATLGLSNIKSGEPDSSHVYDQTDNGQDLTLDVYRPTNQAVTSAAPVIMQVHGGGWTTGDARQTAAENRELADNGYVVVAVNYELATEENPTWDAAPAQVSCAATWINTHAAEIGADINQLAYWGDSAGGNLALNTAYAAAEGTAVSSCEGTVPVPDAVVTNYPAVRPAAAFDSKFEDTPMSAKGFTGTYVGGDPDQYPERYEAIDSNNLINSKAPATLVIEPTQDTLIPTPAVYDFVASAQAAGINAELVKIPFSYHIFDQVARNSIGYQAHMSVGLNFLHNQLK